MSSVVFVDDEPTEPIELEQRAAQRRRSLVTGIDSYLVLTIGVLVAIGLMMVWSTTFFWSEPQSRMFLQQTGNALLGMFIMFIFTMIDYRIWKRFAIPLMAVAIVLLAGVLVLGEERFGARRAYFNGALQPAELAQVITVIYMATWLASKQTKIRNLTYGLLPFALLVGTVAGLIVLEPDLSTAALILITASAMFFLAGADLVQLGLIALAFVIGGFIAVTQFDYAETRINSFVQLLQDPINADADHSQSVIVAFLNGGIGGVGLGESRQKFENLSTPHTDAIFAVIGEELGLIGCAIVVALYVVLMWRGFRVARNAPDAFGSLLAAGITLSIVLEALFNIAVMAAAVPFVGVPLPLVSFGGSALVSGLASLGLLLSVSRVTARKSVPTRKVNEMLNIPGTRVSRVRRAED
jgi:cell division protein FtsW